MSNMAPQFSLLLPAWDTWLFTGTLVVGLPSFAYFCLFKRYQGKPFFGNISKSATYLLIAASLWTMVLLLAAVAHRHHLSMQDFGLHWHQPLRTFVIAGSLFVVLTVLSWFDFRKYSQMSPIELEKRLARVRQFFPSGRPEVIAFVVMAISAGVCEEILYRGWLMTLFGALTGSIWTGLLASSIGFGFGHAYQGVPGILSTACVGLLLGLVFIWIGSLVPIQMIHAFINLSSGLMGAYFFARLKRGASLAAGGG